MLGINSRIPKFKKGLGSLQLVLPLVPIKIASVDKAKGTFLVFELNTWTGQAATSTKYKKYIRKFEEGTPQEWIDLMRDVMEIWMQNSINRGLD